MTTNRSVEDIAADLDRLHESAHVLLAAFPLDPGDWPHEDGEAAVKSLKRWYSEGAKPEQWGDDLPEDSIVMMIANGRERAEKAEAKLARVREYVQHKPLCANLRRAYHSCECGLDELLKETE